jgi:hypothetical protein
MPLAKPNLSPSSTEHLDEYLKQAVEARNVPAVFLGATNADATIYQSQAGELVFGQQEAGLVDENTSKSRTYYASDLVSSPTIFLHQASHYRMSCNTGEINGFSGRVFDSG